ncbi:MAG: hypothetical protein WC306_03570 [Candidatus Paceibacterota bacterium]
MKNTGILFELLVKQISSDTLSGNGDKSKALMIIEKYFKPSTFLGKELQLYNLLLQTKVASEVKANQILESAISQRKILNEKALSKEKYNLIKEIMLNYDIDKFLESKVSGYKVLASIYKVFAIATKPSVFSPNEFIESKNCISESIIKAPASKKKLNEEELLLSEFGKEDSIIRDLTYKVLVENFNKKYKVLNPNQKQLLREYINNTTDNSLKAFLSVQIPKIVKEIKNHLPKLNNKVVAIKLNEVCNQLTRLNEKKIITENDLVKMLAAYELLDEVKLVAKEVGERTK